MVTANKMDNKKSKISLIISIFATILATISIIISFRTCNISEKEYLLKLSPILNITLETNSYADSCSLIIKNAGAIPAHNVHVKVWFRTFIRTLNQYASGMSVGDNSKLVNEIKAGDSIRYYIANKELEKAVFISKIDKRILNLKDEGTISVIYLLFEYFKEPDKTKLSTKKFLTVTDGGDSTFLVEDAIDEDLLFGIDQGIYENFNKINDSLEKVFQKEILKFQKEQNEKAQEHFGKQATDTSNGRFK
jgi:hypothetical protein